MSTANLCTEGGRVVGPQHPVPALPSDHDFGGPSLGCNHLRCQRCGEAVRHQAGLSWGATAEQLAASVDWDALAESGALTRDADHRLYACACRVHVEDYDRHLGRPSDWDFDEVPPPWRCAGHPPVVGSVDGVALSTSPDELVARFALAAPEEAPTFTRDYPVAWLHRLVFLTRPTPVSTALSEACARVIEREAKAGRPVTVMIFDIDHFKSINDRFGHPAGDEMLKLVSIVVVSNLRITDLSGRIGGEEFAALLPCALEEGVLVAERVREAFENSNITCEEGAVDTTVSIGVAGGPAGTELEVLLASADTALYQAKRGGRNRVEAAEELPLSLENWRRKTAGLPASARQKPVTARA